MSRCSSGPVLRYRHLLMFSIQVQVQLKPQWCGHVQVQQRHLHCKKSWRSSSTPASDDTGPIHAGVEKSFRHPWRKCYYKYRTFSTEFFKCWTSSAEMDCLKSNITWAWTYVFRFIFQYSTTAPHFLPYSRAHWRIQSVQRSYIFAPRCLTWLNNASPLSFCYILLHFSYQSRFQGEIASKICIHLHLVNQSL
jgi:hypothetical protein